MNHLDFLATLKPRTVETVGARHRKDQFPCTIDSTAGDPVRDVRHLEAVAADDLADWLVVLDLQNKSPKTLYVYARQIAPILRAHPGKRFDEFTHQDVNEQMRLIPARSRHITRSIYNGWFGWGELEERITRNPMRMVPAIPSPNRRPKDVFTEAERLALENLPTPDGELWTILFGTGLRRGEARMLRRNNINLDRARLYVLGGKGKRGGKDRVVGLPPSVISAVATLDLLERLEPDDYYWYRSRYPAGDWRRHLGPIGDTTFHRWYENGIDAAGVRYLNPHQTRHTYGYWLRSREFTLDERALLMGHEDVRTTQRYDRISVDDVAAKVAAL